MTEMNSKRIDEIYKDQFSPFRYLHISSSYGGKTFESSSLRSSFIYTDRAWVPESKSEQFSEIYKGNFSDFRYLEMQRSYLCRHENSEIFRGNFPAKLRWVRASETKLRTKFHPDPLIFASYRAGTTNNL